MIEYGDVVRDTRDDRVGKVIGFMRWKGVFLVKGNDFESWIAEGYLEKEETCSDTEKESGTPLPASAER